MEKAQALSDKLLFNTKLYKPKALSEIYNQDDMGFEQVKQRQAMGFMANNN